MICVQFLVSKNSIQSPRLTYKMVVGELEVEGVHLPTYSSLRYHFFSYCSISIPLILIQIPHL